MAKKMSLSIAVFWRRLYAYLPPIYDENHKQIGVVAIGLELSRVTQQINDSRWSIIWSVLFGMLVGLIGTCILVKVLKKNPFRLGTLRNLHAV